MDSIKIFDVKDIGEVLVTDDVIAIIAGLAATEVEGVDAMDGGITNEIVAKLGRKNLSAGVNVLIEKDKVSVELALIIKMGYSIPDVCKNVQEKVRTAIETMTGLSVESVNIRIANVNLDND